MNINGVEFFWGKDFLPEGKVFKPIGMVQHSAAGYLTSVPKHMEEINETLAGQAVEMRCNAVILQNRTDVTGGAGSNSSKVIQSATTITGTAGILVAKE
ncbi:MAG: hypothetical protein VX730_02455 [Pseudomonadota bacterium]|nr:hypothetical protein [Pseudomonadota bacterium]